jgi:hypothetical protein
MHATFLTHLAISLIILLYDKKYKLLKSTLRIPFLPLPRSLVQILFSSLCSQTDGAYKWQIALPNQGEDSGLLGFDTML